MLLYIAVPLCAFADGEEPVPHEHPLTLVEKKEAECEKDGIAGHYYCSECNKAFSDELGTKELTEEELIIPKTGHDIVIVDEVPATCTADGHNFYFMCSLCGRLFRDSSAEKETSLENEVIPMHDHTFSFRNSVTRTFNRDGLTEGAYCSECGCVLVPQKITKRYGIPKLTKLKKGKGSLTAVWKAVDDVDGYEIQVSLKKSFKGKKTLTLRNGAAKSKAVKSLKKKKKYFVRVRAYKDIDGARKYSKWSNIKGIKTK